VKKATFVPVLLFAFAVGLFAEDAKALLYQIDARRDVPDMAFELKITSFDGGKAVDWMDLLGSVSLKGDRNRTLVWFADPSSVKGRKMLMDGPVIYLLFPKTRNPIRLSPLQVLTGQTANGDIARSSFSLEFDPSALERVDYDGRSCWLFTLTAKEALKSSTYRKVRLWVDASNLRPIHGEFFTSGDSPLKTIDYADFHEVGGADVPFLLKITDVENPNLHTDMQYGQVTSHRVPDSEFRREYLETWMPEGIR